MEWKEEGERSPSPLPQPCPLNPAPGSSRTLDWRNHVTCYNPTKSIHNDKTKTLPFCQRRVIFCAYHLQSPNHPFNLAQRQERSKRARKPNFQVGDARCQSRAAKEMVGRSTEIEWTRRVVFGQRILCFSSRMCAIFTVLSTPRVKLDCSNFCLCFLIGVFCLFLFSRYSFVGQFCFAHLSPSLCQCFWQLFSSMYCITRQTQSVPAETPTMFVDSFVLRQLFSLIVYYFGISSSSTIFGVKNTVSCLSLVTRCALGLM